jgi:hypothetical protein
MVNLMVRKETARVLKVKQDLKISNFLTSKTPELRLGESL